MLLMGLGLGFNFQPVILAVQNAVSPREIGVATSSVTFFRQMGGTLGTAVFLSVLFTRLPIDIGDALTSAAHTDPRVGAALSSGQLKGGSSALSDTSFIQKLPEFLALPFKTGFANTLDLVFLIAAAVVAVGFFVMIFLPQIPLRTMSGIQAAQEGAGEPAAETTAKAVGAAAPTSVDPDGAPAAGPAAREHGVPVDGTADARANAAGRDGGAAHGRHEAPDGEATATGLASIPADHLPEGVQPAGRPKD
jgi:hypothetical protein